MALRLKNIYIFIGEFSVFRLKRKLKLLFHPKQLLRRDNCSSKSPAVIQSLFLKYEKPFWVLRTETKRSRQWLSLYSRLIFMPVEGKSVMFSYSSFFLQKATIPYSLLVFIYLKSFPVRKT